MSHNDLFDVPDVPDVSEQPPPPRVSSAGGLVPPERVLAFAGICLARQHKDLQQPAYRALCDLQRYMHPLVL